MSTAPHRTYTVEEYLELEKRSEIKHEFYLGEVFAMAGASRAHVRIADNIFFRLRRALDGRDCQPSSSDQRIYVRTARLHTYPDVSVVCGGPQSDPKDPEANTNPVLLVEVLSTSTERYDRTTKFRMYKQIASLREYILVSQNEALVEKFSRDENNNWITSEAVGHASSMAFPSIDCELALADIYEGVELDPPPTEKTIEFHERPSQ